MNDDNTLKYLYSCKDGEKYRCVCSATIKNGVKVSDLAVENKNFDHRVMPLSYCLCCAGSIRSHLQLKLNIRLITKEIISSPINSKGKKPCEIVFEIDNR